MNKLLAVLLTSLIVSTAHAADTMIQDYGSHGTPATGSDKIVTLDATTATKVRNIAFSGLATDVFTGTGTWLSSASWLTAESDPAFASWGLNYNDLINRPTVLAAGDLLLKTNATPFVPTADYHPATKKYVDDLVIGAGAYVAGTGIDITEGVISSTVVDTDTDTLVALNCGAGYIPLMGADDEWGCTLLDLDWEPYTAGDNISIASGIISVTGLDLADLSDAGAAAYLDADNGEIGDVAVWVGVCSDTSFKTEELCLDNSGTWGPALPISVGEAEVTVDAGLFAGKNLKSMLNELGQRVKGVESGTTPLTIGVQSADPAAGDMTTGQIIAATTSGDLFIRSAGGLFTIPGTYAAVTACSTPADGNIFNEGFEGVGYEVSSWEATGSVNPNNTPSGTGLTGSCERNLLVSADGANAYIHRDQGSALTYPVDIYFDLYIDSDDMAHNDTVTLLDSWSGSWGNVARVNVQRRTDGDYFRISATGAVNSSTTALALDTWYRVRLHLAATEASSYIKIGAGSDLSFTRQSVDIQLLRFGASSVSATETILLEMDRISVSDGS